MKLIKLCHLFKEPETMKEYPFLPMSIKNDELTISEPFASKMSKNFSKESMNIESDHIIVSIKDIDEKEKFVENIATSLKKVQKDMIQSYLNQKTMRYL